MNIMNVWSTIGRLYLPSAEDFAPPNVEIPGCTGWILSVHPNCVVSHRSAFGMFDVAHTHAILYAEHRRTILSTIVR